MAPVTRPGVSFPGSSSGTGAGSAKVGARLRLGVRSAPPGICFQAESQRVSGFGLVSSDGKAGVPARAQHVQRLRGWGTSEGGVHQRFAGAIGELGFRGTCSQARGSGPAPPLGPHPARPPSAGAASPEPEPAGPRLRGGPEPAGHLMGRGARVPGSGPGPLMCGRPARRQLVPPRRPRRRSIHIRRRRPGGPPPRAPLTVVLGPPALRAGRAGGGKGCPPGPPSRANRASPRCSRLAPIRLNLSLPLFWLRVPLRPVSPSPPDQSVSPTPSLGLTGHAPPTPPPRREAVDKAEALQPPQAPGFPVSCAAPTPQPLGAWSPR